MAEQPQWHDPGENRHLIYEVVEYGGSPWAVRSYASELQRHVSDNAEIRNPRLSPTGRYWIFTVRTTKSGWDTDLIEQLPEEDEHEGSTIHLRSLCPDFRNHYR